MRFVLVLCTSLFIIGATSAHAQDCETTAYYGVASSYGFQDVGDTIYDRPVGQGGVTRTCGRWSVDLYTTTALSTEGSYGNRHLGDEVDLTVSYDDTITSPFGDLEVSASVGYWMIADFGHFGDDFVALSAQVGRPFSVGESTTVTPYVQVNRWMQVDGSYRTNLLRTGVGLAHEFSDQWSGELDVSYVMESYDSLRTGRVDVHVTRSFDNGLALTGSLLFAERMDPVVMLSLSSSF